MIPQFTLSLLPPFVVLALLTLGDLLGQSATRFAGHGKIDLIAVRDRIDVFSSATGGRKIGERTDCAFEVFLVGTGGFHKEAPGGTIPQLIEAYTLEGDRIGFLRSADVIYNRREALLATRRETGGLSNYHRMAFAVPDGKGALVGLRDPGLDPGKENVHRRIYLYHEPYYVWAERTMGGREWWLLSLAPQFLNPDTRRVRQAMMGWFPSDRLMRWDTRRAVEHDWETRRRRIEAAGGTVEQPGDARSGRGASARFSWRAARIRS